MAKPGPAGASDYDTLPDVCVAAGFGVSLTVRSGHLVVADGVGATRRVRRYGRAGHGLRSLIVAGSAGSVSVEAMSWLDHVGIPWVWHDHTGRPLAVGTHGRSDDARLRRSQALHSDSEVGRSLMVDLLTGKLAGQASNLRTLGAPDAADEIEAQSTRLSRVVDAGDALMIEAAAANVYFDSWRDRVAVTFARRDLPIVPDRWHSFSSRRSQVGKVSARNATDPINALLNYLYGLAEGQARLACLAVGLDPGIGVLHVDAAGRDSLTLDLLEPIRPTVDRWLIELLEAHVFKAADFTESKAGTVRIVPPLVHHIASTAQLWLAEVAPWAETVAHGFADASPRQLGRPTPLTSTNRRRSAALAAESRRGKRPPATADQTTPLSAPLPRTSAPPKLLRHSCAGCGARLAHHQRTYCATCWPTVRTEAGVAGSRASAATLADPAVRDLRSEQISAGREHGKVRAALAAGFEPGDYQRLIGPFLRTLAVADIGAATGLSAASAYAIRAGRRQPHPRHWASLLKLLR